jgi:hypothetical protein
MTARLFEVATLVDKKFQEQGLEFCFIGGIAVQRWGMPRSTVDLDLTVLAPFGGESGILDALLRTVAPRIEDARGFALRHRVLLGQVDGVPVDIALGAMPFEEASVARATFFEVGSGLSFRTCGPSDLIIHKVFAGRDQDWVDVRSILVRSGRLIDWDLVVVELEMLLALKEDSASLPRLETLRLSLGP